MPRSTLGVTALILSFSIGAAFSGAILYSYYEFKKDRTEKRVAGFIRGFDERFKNAVATVRAEGHNARADIQEEIEPLRKARTEGETIEELARKVAPSVFFVTTLDEAGQPSVGSAFAVGGDAGQTLLLTSYTTVKAATRGPGPELGVRKGAERLGATLWTWQEDKDLALLVIAKADVPALRFGGPTEIGDRVFAVSGLGGSDAAISQGLVADVSAAGMQHDAAVGQAFQGGPLVDADGAVVGMASRSYAPLGFASDHVFFAPPIGAACERVLSCPGGGGPAAAGPRTGPPE